MEGYHTPTSQKTRKMTVSNVFSNFQVINFVVFVFVLEIKKKKKTDKSVISYVSFNSSLINYWRGGGVLFVSL